MKSLFSAFLLTVALLPGASHAQQLQTTGYMWFGDQPSTAHYFVMGHQGYLDYCLPIPVAVVAGGPLYQRVVRVYVGDKTDTLFYREDSTNYYHYARRTGHESVALPKKVRVGDTWLEADSSWRYEVVAVAEKLTTPARRYRDLLHLRCTQLTQRDAHKYAVYEMYYAPQLGLVASSNAGELMSYLAEIKTNAQAGDRLGRPRR